MQLAATITVESRDGSGRGEVEEVLGIDRGEALGGADSQEMIGGAGRGVGRIVPPLECDDQDRLVLTDTDTY